MERDKYTGKENRIFCSLKYFLESKACYGKSRHKDKEEAREQYKAKHGGSLEGWNPSKLPGIYSFSTMKTYISQMRPFARYCAEQGARRVSGITEEMGRAYLRHLEAEGKSGWTISTAASAINKAVDWDLSPKALGLPGRRKKNIMKCRIGDAYTKKEYEIYKDQITMARAIGARRSSIYNKNNPNKMITPNRCVRNKDGIVVGVWLVEKGGKVRCAPVLNEYKVAVTEIVDRLTKERGYDVPMFDAYGGHIRNHRLRAEYAGALLHRLEDERKSEKPLFGGEFPLSDYCRLKGKDKKRKKTTQGHDTDLLAAVSGALGHNRVEVVLRHYMYLY